MKIYYVSGSSGEKLDLLTWPYRLQTGDFFDFSWDYENSTSRRHGGKITRFTRGIWEKTLVLSVGASNKKEYYKALNKFFEATERDLISLTPGRLYVGEYYLPCFVTASSKTDWESDVDILDNTIKIVAEYPFWCREIVTSYWKSVQEIEAAEQEKEVEDIISESKPGEPSFPFDFPAEFQCRYKRRFRRPLFDFAFDFRGRRTSGRLINDHYCPCDYLMRVYGPCTAVSVYIGNHLYEVRIELYDGERLEVDSRYNTVTRIGRHGYTQNCFNLRNKESDLFQKIPEGQNIVKWNAQFDFDITLFQERSEPRWSF